MFVTALDKAVSLSHQPAIARRQLRETLADAGWPGDVDGALLATQEALVNAQRHAGGVSRAAAGFDGDSLVVQVWDRGSGFRIPPRSTVPDALAERGRGLFLMRLLATDVRVCRSDGDVGLLLRFDP